MNGLSVKNIYQSFAGQHVLKGISVSASAGSVTVFLGPNGAGKTTLLKSIIGLYPQSKKDNSSVTLNGNDLSSAPVHKRVHAGLLYVPQQSSLFSQMTLEHNMAMVYEYHKYWKNKSRSDFNAHADELLEKIALIGSKQKKVSLLSGGQRRKAEVVRALLMHPKAILFDEPFAGVDPKSIYELKNLFTDMAQDGIAVVVSDHHVDQLLSIADTVYVIISGEVVTSGTIEQIMQDKDLKERYLGSAFHAEVAKKYL